MPLSIFVLYTPSRRRQFEQFNRFLSKCEGYHDCQKLLIADNRTDIEPVGYETIVVPRRGKYFCWSDAWTAAMRAVRRDRVLYLDCDRIIPTWYLNHLTETLKDYEFVHPARLWNLYCDLPDEKLNDQLSSDLYWVEQVTADYLSLPCRGPLSGTSAFTTATYHHVGQLDDSYIGWGFPDLEHQESIKAKGCLFRPVDTNVLHLKHEYEIDNLDFLRVNVWNGVRFFRKWNLPQPKRFQDSLLQLGLTTEQLLAMSLDELYGQIKSADDSSDQTG